MWLSRQGLDVDEAPRDLAPGWTEEVVGHTAVLLDVGSVEQARQRLDDLDEAGSRVPVLLVGDSSPEWAALAGRFSRGLTLLTLPLDPAQALHALGGLDGVQRAGADEPAALPQPAAVLVTSGAAGAHARAEPEPETAVQISPAEPRAEPKPDAQISPAEPRAAAVLDPPRPVVPPGLFSVTTSRAPDRQGAAVRWHVAARPVPEPEPEPEPEPLPEPQPEPVFRASPPQPVRAPQLERPAEARPAPGSAAGAASGTPLLELVAALRARIDSLHSVRDVADLVLTELVERCDAAAGAALMLAEPGWVVEADVGLRPLEGRLVVPADHWFVRHLVDEELGLLVTRSDGSGHELAGVPLASWEHLAAALLPQGRLLIVLASADRSFDEGHLELIRSVDAESKDLLAEAVAVRELALALAPLAEEATAGYST